MVLTVSQWKVCFFQYLHVMVLAYESDEAAVIRTRPSFAQQSTQASVPMHSL
jgi:hypothetical protein